MNMKNLSNGAVAALAVCGALAAFGAGAKIEQSFESDTANWSGGTQKETTYEYSGSIGLPLSGTHEKVYAVSGEATYAAESGSLLSGGQSAASVDLMFYVASTDNTLDTEIADSGLIMLGLDGSTVNVGVRKDDKTTWTATSATLGTGWHRATFAFNYATAEDATTTCCIMLDGEALTNDGGIWFDTASTGARTSSNFGGIVVKGETSLDDVVVSDAVDALAEAVPAGATVAGDDETEVSVQWLVKYGKASATGKAANEKYTVAQAYLAGIDPTKEDAELLVEALTVDTSGNSKISYTVPATINGTATLKYSTDGGKTYTDAGSAAAGGTITVDALSAEAPSMLFQLTVAAAK